jgi:uncharacterized OB-fold protein
MMPNYTVLGPCPVQGGVQALADDFRATVRAHRVAVAQACGRCRTANFPPLLACRSCGSYELQWISCGPTGTIGTYVTVHTADATPSMSIPRRLLDRVPYTSIYASPDAVPTIRVAALMVGGQQERLKVGAAVTFDVGADLQLMANLTPEH